MILSVVAASSIPEGGGESFQEEHQHRRHDQGRQGEGAVVHDAHRAEKGGGQIGEGQGDQTGDDAGGEIAIAQGGEGQGAIGDAFRYRQQTGDQGGGGIPFEVAQGDRTHFMGDKTQQGLLGRWWPIEGVFGANDRHFPCKRWRCIG